MNTPIPVDPPSGWKPTSSTVLGGAAGALTTVIVGLSAAYGHPIDGVTAAALATLITILANYIHPNGGRQ